MKKLVLIVFGIIPILTGCGDEPPCTQLPEGYGTFFTMTQDNVPLTEWCAVSTVISGSGVDALGNPDSQNLDSIRLR